jgi:hypothetical protein
MLRRAYCIAVWSRVIAKVDVDSHTRDKTTIARLVSANKRAMSLRQRQEVQKVLRRLTRASAKLSTGIGVTTARNAGLSVDGRFTQPWHPRSPGHRIQRRADRLITASAISDLAFVVMVINPHLTRSTSKPPILRRIEPGSQQNSAMICDSRGTRSGGFGDKNELCGRCRITSSSSADPVSPCWRRHRSRLAGVGTGSTARVSQLDPGLLGGARMHAPPSAASRVARSFAMTTNARGASRPLPAASTSRRLDHAEHSSRSLA